MKSVVHAVLLIAAIGLIGVVASAGQRGATAQRPNVILIMTDDVGYGDIGSYGSRDIKTPHIDRLAREGVKLTDFYAAPQCTPTRAALITGRYQQRVRMDRALGPLPAALDDGLAPNGRSLPQLLKNHRYATGLIGKWHLGWKPAFGPNAHGFDYFYGFLSGYIDFYTHRRSDGGHDLFENTAPVHDDGYMTDLITMRSLRFIEQHAATPFFLEVSYNAAHWPFQPPEQPSVAANNSAFQGPGAVVPATRKDYIAMLERADAGVGQILRKLDALKLAQDTLVIFTNDNGGEWLSNNAPLFHRKDTLWEGGIRVPAIMRWPGRIPAGTVSAQAGITMDLTASILAATGAPIPANAKLEGLNLLPILQGASPAVERTFYWRIDNPTRQQRAVRAGDWKLLIDGDDLLLYNLRQDIGERTDLAAQRPDIVRKLQPLIAEWEKDVDAEGKAK